MPSSNASTMTSGSTSFGNKFSLNIHIQYFSAFYGLWLSTATIPSIKKESFSILGAQSSLNFFNTGESFNNSMLINENGRQFFNPIHIHLKSYCIKFHVSCNGQEDNFVSLILFHRLQDIRN